MKSLIGKGLFVLMTLGFMGVAIPTGNADASERRIVRTERRWVGPHYGTRYFNGVPRSVIIQDGYWDSVPIYDDGAVTYSTPYYSYPTYYNSYPYYSYPSYGYYGSGLGLNFRFGGGYGGGHWRHHR